LQGLTYSSGMDVFEGLTWCVLVIQNQAESFLNDWNPI
jgi:hypothetical protein